jgi:hypothetical protein
MTVVTIVVNDERTGISEADSGDAKVHVLGGHLRNCSGCRLLVVFDEEGGRRVRAPGGGGGGQPNTISIKLGHKSH